MKIRTATPLCSFGLWLSAAAAWGTPPAAGTAPRVSFLNDVVPVLTRAGCNQGTCHGAAAGRNGFKLSLRGFAPELDYLAITRQTRGRRINLAAPAQSLLLQKPLLELPHLGGPALRRGSLEHKILSAWFAQGAPGPDPQDARVTRLIVTPAVRTLAPGARLNLRIEALFSDGQRRDVTHWARYASNDENIATVAPDGAVCMTGVGDTSIMIGYQDRVAVSRLMVPFPNRIPPIAYTRLPRFNRIDDHVNAKLAALHLWPSPPATDADYIRRLSLDLIGVLPSADEIRAFVAERDPRKAEKLVEALMRRTEFVDFWTYKWCDLLRVNRGTLKEKGMWAFYSYIHDSVRDNRPWDVMTREILTATGNTFLDGPANYFRTALKPEELAENVSQGFLGIRVQCARCHNHPLEKWTQNEYYGMANIFARVKYKANLGIYVNDEMTVYNVSEGDLSQPRLGRPVPPKPLGGPELALDASRERRAFLAEWMTRPENWYFTHATVNRVWAHFLGRGLVEPVDDLRETNPPSNPALFDALTRDFVEHKFDLRHLMRQIVLSQTYRRSSTPDPRNAADTRYYSRYFVKRLTAEQLLDALCQVTGIPEQFPGLPAGLRAIQLPDTHVKSEFMDSFGRPPRQITCECERSQEPSMAQALIFINGDLINRKVTAEGGLVDRLIRSDRTDSELLEQLYWTTLGRAPRQAERSAGLAIIRKALAAPRQNQPVTAETGGVPPAPAQKAPPAATAAQSAAPTEKSGMPPPAKPAADTAGERRRQAFQDLLWVLVNSKEFLFNH